MSKVDVITEIKICCPIEKVSTYASNPLNAKVWYDKIVKSEWVEGSEIKVGNKAKFEAHFMGKKLIYTYLISHYEKGKKLVMETSEGPFPMKTIYTWNAFGNKETIMTLQNTGTTKGFSTLFNFLMVPMMKKANKKDLLSIKRILEKRP